MATDDKPNPAEKFARQRRLVIGLGILLVVAGILILTVLSRLPMPLRMMAGLGDIFIGLVLLVMVSQAKPPAR